MGYKKNITGTDGRAGSQQHYYHSLAHPTQGFLLVKVIRSAGLVHLRRVAAQNSGAPTLPELSPGNVGSTKSRSSPFTMSYAFRAYGVLYNNVVYHMLLPCWASPFRLARPKYYHFVGDFGSVLYLFESREPSVATA